MEKLEKALELRKAKYLKRTGGPGNYKYIYREGTGRKEVQDHPKKKIPVKIEEKEEGKHLVSRQDYRAIVSQIKEEGSEWKGLTKKQEHWGSMVLGWFADIWDGDPDEVDFTKIKDADRAMRKDKKVSPVLEEAVKVIKDFVALSPKYKGSISRGIEAKVDLEVGSIYEMPGLSSFGRGPTPPEGWEESETIFVVKKNTRGADFSRMSPFGDEQREIVVDSGKYKVVDKKKREGQIVYYFEEE